MSDIKDLVGKKKGKKLNITPQKMKALKKVILDNSKEKPELIFDISKILFPEQLAFATTNARFSVACCSRRAGKSIAIAASLVDTAIRYPGRYSLYLTLSKTSAKGIIWKELNDMTLGMGLDVKVNNHELIMKFWNGSEIHIGGAKDTTEIEKYRGWKFQMIVLDEAQSFKPFIREFIRDILMPALGDFQGKFKMTGTPNPSCKGVFYEACHQIEEFKTWEHHHWTLEKNTKFPAFVQGLTTYDEMMQEVLEDRGITRDNPSFLREYMGVWAQENNSLVYNCPEDSRIEILPNDEWKYILAYDTGFRDDDAFSVIAYSATDTSAYCVDAHNLPPKYGEDGEELPRSFSDVAEHIKSLNEQYGGFMKIVL